MPDNPENQENQVTAEELQQQLEQLQQQLKERDDKLTELTTTLSSSKREMIDKRDAAKREAEQALIEQQKHLEAYQSLKADFELYKKDWNEDKFNGLKSELDNLVNAQRQKLLAQLPDENDRKVFGDLPIEKLEAVVAKLSGGVVIPVDSATNHGTKTNVPKRWADMSEQQRIDLAEADPKKANELMKEFMKERRK